MLSRTTKHPNSAAQTMTTNSLIKPFSTDGSVRITTLWTPPLKWNENLAHRQNAPDKFGTNINRKYIPMPLNIFSREAQAPGDIT